MQEHVVRVIEQYTKLNKLDALLSFCNSCIYPISGETLAHVDECQTCEVQRGVNRISKGWKREPVEGEELLGVC
jgi:hypothetical protein